MSTLLIFEWSWNYAVKEKWDPQTFTANKFISFWHWVCSIWWRYHCFCSFSPISLHALVYMPKWGTKLGTFTGASWPSKKKLTPDCPTEPLYLKPPPVTEWSWRNLVELSMYLIVLNSCISCVNGIYFLETNLCCLRYCLKRQPIPVSVQVQAFGGGA